MEFFEKLCYAVLFVNVIVWNYGQYSWIVFKTHTIFFSYNPSTSENSELHGLADQEHVPGIVEFPQDES